MKYAGWIDFPSFSIAINKTEDNFRCQKFVDNVIVRDANFDCITIDEIEEFLRGFANPPSEEIDILINKLKLQSKE